MNDLVKSILTFATAWLLIIGSFWFLYVILTSLADPDQAALPESPLGIIIGGLIAILTMAVQFVVQAEASRSTARAINAAAAAGMAGTTVTATSGPPATVTAGPAEPVEEIKSRG